MKKQLFLIVMMSAMATVNVFGAADRGYVHDWTQHLVDRLMERPALEVEDLRQELQELRELRERGFGAWIRHEAIWDVINTMIYRGGGCPAILPELFAFLEMDVNYGYRDGETALVHAIRFGNVAMVKALLQVPGIDIYALGQNIRGETMTALELAEEQGHPVIVAMLEQYAAEHPAAAPQPAQAAVVPAPAVIHAQDTAPQPVSPVVAEAAPFVTPPPVYEGSPWQSSAPVIPSSEGSPAPSYQTPTLPSFNVMQLRDALAAGDTGVAVSLLDTHNAEFLDRFGQANLDRLGGALLRRGCSAALELLDEIEQRSSNFQQGAGSAAGE